MQIMKNFSHKYDKYETELQEGFPDNRKLIVDTDDL